VRLPSVKLSRGENYDHKHVGKEVNVIVILCECSFGIEVLGQSFFNNNCLVYDECAANMFVIREKSHCTIFTVDF
jgi:hypothetical protein